MWNWINDHWTWVALAVSEILPFIPNKVNGIISGIVRFLGLFLTKTK